MWDYSGATILSKPGLSRSGGTGPGDFSVMATGAGTWRRAILFVRVLALPELGGLTMGPLAMLRWDVLGWSYKATKSLPRFPLRLAWLPRGWPATKSPTWGDVNSTGGPSRWELNFNHIEKRWHSLLLFSAPKIKWLQLSVSLSPAQRVERLGSPYCHDLLIPPQDLEMTRPPSWSPNPSTRYQMWTFAIAGSDPLPGILLQSLPDTRYLCWGIPAMQQVLFIDNFVFYKIVPS